jgi:hypothetical protein
VAKEAAPAAVREAQLGDALIEVCQQRLEIGLPRRRREQLAARLLRAEDMSIA